jgi:glycosyltransferase involved in cell wall biosynthesis
MPRHQRIIFVSMMAGEPWGGSEELWSRTAVELVSQGVPVSASVAEWSPLHPRVAKVRARGVDLWVRPSWYSWHEHPWRRLASRRDGQTKYAIEQILSARPPSLVVFSDGVALPPIELLELCIAKGVPFVTLGQANWEGFWYADDLAARYRVALAAALRCFFVSQANRRLAEKQIGGVLGNAEVVWNPVNISFDASPAWPPLGRDSELRFACVGRLHWPSKGQDILFEALAGPSWKNRPWGLYLYGEGSMRQGLERLAQNLGLSGRIVFAGFTSVEEIWAANHALVMPSRYEGLPLAMVEAMLCGRPVVATNVAGHAEIIEDGITGFLADAPTASAVAAALERFWEQRSEAEEIGKAGARRIRQLMPPDPVRVFSDKLKTLAEIDLGLSLPGTVAVEEEWSPHRPRALDLRGT